MINETLQLLARFAQHPEHGLNDLAGTIPRANIDPAKPDDEAPPALQIVTVLDDEGAAKDLNPETLPCFMMWGVTSARITYGTYKIARQVTIAGAFVTDENADPLSTSNACGYILRGGTMTFWRFNSQSNSQGYRELNGITIMEVRSVTEHRVTYAEGRCKMWGFLELEVIVVDTLQ